MNEIILDTETTGLSIKDDHRIIEIAGVELIIPTTLSLTWRIRVSINNGRSGLENRGNGVGDRHIHISKIIKHTAMVVYTAVFSLHHDLKLLPK